MFTQPLSCDLGCDLRGLTMSDVNWSLKSPDDVLMAVSEGLAVRA